MVERYREQLNIDPAEREILKNTNIFIVGLPGAGKSSVLPELAAITGMKPTDSDQLFKEWTGIDPNDFINDKGMPAFRIKESSVLELAITNTDQIIATGGGIVETPKNVGEMIVHGEMIYLEAEIDTLLDRIANDPDNHRSGLMGTRDENRAELIRRYERRHRAFESAPIKIKVDKISARQVASIAKQQVLRRKRESQNHIYAAFK